MRFVVRFVNFVGFVRCEVCEVSEVFGICEMMRYCGIGSLFCWVFFFGFLGVGFGIFFCGGGELEVFFG